MPSRTSILETLSKIVSNPPKITPKSSTLLRHTLHYIPDTMSAHPFLTFLLVLIGCVVAFYMYVRRAGSGSGGRNSRLWGHNTGGFFQLPLNNGGGSGGGMDSRREKSGGGGAGSGLSGSGSGLGAAGHKSGAGDGIISAFFGGNSAGKKD